MDGNRCLDWIYIRGKGADIGDEDYGSAPALLGSLCERNGGRWASGEM